MKPTEKEIEAAAKAIAFTQLTTTAELTEQEIKTIDDKIWQNHKVAASAALEAAYLLREADTVEVVTGEPEEDDLAMDCDGNIGYYGSFDNEDYEVESRWVAMCEGLGFDESDYTIIIRDDKPVLDRRKK